MTSNSLKLLDPVQGLVDFVLDIKPYHTKIVEVLIEYVYNEFVDVTIIDEMHTKIDLFYPKLPADRLTPLSCDGGYSTRPYGDPGRHPIISPNPTISFESFPAINTITNSFTIPSDKSGDFKLGARIFITSQIEDYSDVHNITGIKGGAADITNPPTFMVMGDQTTQFVVGYIFDVNGTIDNDRSYSVLEQSTYDAGTNATTIPVGQSIPSSIPYGQLGVVKTTIPENTGEFTVAAVEYNAGMIDSWPDITDANAYSLGDNPHTIVTTIEPLTAVPVLTATQIYVSWVAIAPVVIDGLLSYSNHIAVHHPTIPDFTQTPDEGTNQRDLVLVVPSIDDGFGSPISDSGKFTISGNFSVSNVFVGDEISVSGSDNGGRYTVTSIAYDDIADETTFGVAEIVPTSNADGKLTMVIPANVFIVSGDWTKRFHQGVEFNIIGGSINADSYQVIESRFNNEKTQIRVLGDVIDADNGFAIVGGDVAGFTLRGDKSNILSIGTQFNVSGSPANDGAYDVDVGGPVYDSITNTTYVPVDGVLGLGVGGDVYVFSSGMIVDRLYGYSESSPVCDYIPETVVHVMFAENLKFSAGHLDLSDDLLVYNMENSDTWGYELPIDTIINASTPVIASQSSAPLSFSPTDLWYDTTLNVFKQHNGVGWKAITTAWWRDTTSGVLYYRTKNKLIDTGWVMDSVAVPGYSSFIPAVGERELIATEPFTTYDMGGVFQDTFTLSTPIPGADPALILVTINNIPAGITVNSSTEFTILHPDWKVDDVVEARIFSATTPETNAHVTGFNQIPHTAYHDYVTVDSQNDAYIVGGGNFSNRFQPSLSFRGVKEGKGGGLLDVWNASQYSIIDVDDVLGTITINGDLTWLFATDRVLTIRTSETNNKSFLIDASLYDGTHTTISVMTPISESPIGAPSHQHFYNPGVTIYNIDAVTNTVVVFGDVTDVYYPGLVTVVESSTEGNNNEWTVVSSIYDPINERTNISMAGDIPDADSSLLATIHTPIFQNYSRDLGVVLGVVYDPDSTISYADDNDSNTVPDPLIDGIYRIGQVKTIVATSTTVNADVDGIAYDWVGPVEFDIAQVRSNTFIATLADSMGVTDELLSVPDRFGILDTSEVGNYFVIGHTDPVTGLPVDLTGSFTQRTIFDVVGSYSNNSPTTLETNDAKYVVARTFYDDETLRYTATGGETKVPFALVYGSYEIYRDAVLLVDGVDYGNDGDNTLCFGDVTDCFGVGTALTTGEVISQVPVGTPIAWSTGSNNTFIQVDTDYNNIPPYNSFDVVGVSNNGASLNTVRLSGNHVTLFTNFADPIFRVDQPLVSVDQKLNVLTVVSVEYDSNNVETVLTISEELIDEAFVGSIGLVEVAYSGDVFHDATNVTLPWVHGDIMRDSVRIEQTDATFTSATIEDDLIFGWGTVELWPIVATDNTTNLEIIDLDGNVATPDIRLHRGLISIDTDITGVLELNDRVTIKGSQGNDDNYEVALMTYNVGTTDTEIVLRNQPKAFGITTTDDTAGSLDGTYVLISSATTDFYVWFDVDNGGNDPMVSGRTGIEVHVPINAAADVVATNTAYAIDQTSDFSSTSTTNEVAVLALSSIDPLQYARDGTTGFEVNNYTIPTTPDAQFGYLELKGIDITNWFQYTVKEYNTTTNEIIINGNGMGDIQSGQQIRVIGTRANDGVFTVGLSPTFGLDGTTTIPVDEVIASATNDIIEFISPTSVKVLGDSYRMVSTGDAVDVIGSTGNDGTYTVTGSTQDGAYSIIDISPSLPNTTPDGVMAYMERGGWIESVRYQGIHLIHEDWIGVGISEVAQAATLTDGGNVVGAWDYPHWDVGSFDESLGTVIRLYSSTFTA